MPKALIAIATCHPYEDRVRIQRETWGKDNTGWADVRFFYGRGARRDPLPDEVFLDCRDDYEGLPEKVRAVHAWSLEHGYEHTFKCDDDTFLYLDVLGGSGYQSHDYTGRERVASGGYPATYASGGAGYWLSARASKIIAGSPMTDDWAEDRWVANTLLAHGITCRSDEQYCYIFCGKVCGSLAKAAAVCFVEQELNYSRYRLRETPSLLKFLELLPKGTAATPPRDRDVRYEKLMVNGREEYFPKEFAPKSSAPHPNFPLYVPSGDPRYPHMQPAPVVNPLYVNTVDPSKSVLWPAPEPPAPILNPREHAQFIPPINSEGKLPLYIHTPDPSKK